MSGAILFRVAYVAKAMLVSWCFAWLCIGAWHCFPNAEDISVSADVVERGAIGATVELLLTYDGRYFTNILHALNPLAQGWFMGYQAMPVIGLLAVTLSLYLLLRTIGRGEGGRWWALLIAMAYMAVHMAVTPSLPHDLYWMISSFVFMWPWALFFLFISTMLRFLRSAEGWHRHTLFMLCATALFCGIGMNEMFLVPYSLALALMMRHAHREGKVLTALPILIVGLGSIGLFLSCPGITHRMADQEVVRDWGHVANVLHWSIAHLSNFILDAFFANALVLPSAFLAATMLPDGLISRLGRIPWEQSVAWLSVGAACLLAMSWAYYWPMGAEETPPHRVQACLLYGVQLWACGLTARVRAAILMAMPRATAPSHTRWLSPAAALLTLIAVMVSDNNIALLREELESGRLQAYREQMLERHQTLQASSRSGGWNVATLPPISTLPRTVHHPPLMSANREGHYWNKAYERYYRLDEVRLGTDTLTKLEAIIAYGKR